MATREELKQVFANGQMATGEKFANLIDSMKVVQLPVVDPQALGTSLSFIDSISQDADGKITATKKRMSPTVGSFQFVANDATAEAAFTAVGAKYSGAISGVSPSADTLGVILLMNDDDTTPTKTMMITTEEVTPATNPATYQFVYVGDLSSALPSGVLTAADIVNGFTGGVNKVLSAESGAELAGKTNEVNVGNAASLSAAIALVPQGMRKLGVKVTFMEGTTTNNSMGWVTVEFVGNSVDDWSDTDKWKSVGDRYSQEYYAHAAFPKHYTPGYFSSSGTSYATVGAGTVKVAWIKVYSGDVVSVKTFLNSSSNKWIMVYCDHIPTTSDTLEPLYQGVYNQTNEFTQPIIKDGYVGIRFNLADTDHETTIQVIKNTNDFAKLVWDSSLVQNAKYEGDGVEVIDTTDLESHAYNQWNRSDSPLGLSSYTFDVEAGYFYVCKLYEVANNQNYGTITFISNGNPILTKHIIGEYVIVPKGVTQIAVLVSTVIGAVTSVKKHPISDMINSSLVKFKSNENVEDVLIVNGFGGGVHDVLSAEAGKNLADITTDIVISPNILNPSTIKEGYYIKSNNGQEDTGLESACYGCTDFIELTEVGLICNNVMISTGTYGRGAVIYNENKNYIGYKAKEGITAGGLSIAGDEFIGAKYVRFNLGKESNLPSDEFFAVYNATELPAQYSEWFEPYRKIKDVQIEDGSITVSKLANTSEEFISNNICDPNTFTTTSAHYINKNTGVVGDFTDSNILGYTAYIPIDERGLAFTGILYSGQVVGGAVYYYKDGSYRYKRSAGSTGIVEFDGGDATLPESNAMHYADAVVRFTIRKTTNVTSADDVMVNIGTEKLPFEPYLGSKKVISEEILPNFNNELKERSILSSKLELLVPHIFYAVRGDILQIFNNGLGKIIGYENRYIRQNCSIGSQYKRYYELDATLRCAFTVTTTTSVSVGDTYSCNGNIFKVTAFSNGLLSCIYMGYNSLQSTGTLSKISGDEESDSFIAYTNVVSTTPTVGDRALNFEIYDDNQNILGKGNTILRVVNYPKSPSSEKHILCVGASTLGGDLICEAQRRLLASDGTPQGNGLSNIKFVGSDSITRYGQTANFYGNSGWGWKDYATAGQPIFRFYLVGTGNQVVQGNKYTNNNHEYTVMEVNTIEGVETIKCYTDSSLNVPLGNTLTSSSPSSYSSLSFSDYALNNPNLFWDIENEKLDFISYATAHCEGSINILYTILGVNRMFDGVSVQEGYVRTFVESLHNDFPNCKIILATDAYPSMKLMMPGYGASGDEFANTYRVKTLMVDTYKMYKKLADEYSYVDFELWAAQVDSDYNWSIADKDVNTRNSSYQEPYASNTIHPGQKGYFQEADCLYRSIVANLCQEE